MTAVSYQNDPALKSRFVAHVQAHREQDRVRQGSYGTEVDGVWRGCAVACSLRSLDEIEGKRVPSKGSRQYGDHPALAQRLGIPLTLAYLEDRIFEGLPLEWALEWPTRFARAIPIGRDLSGVWPGFAHWLLVDPEHGVLRFANTDQTRDVVSRVAALYEREIAGDRPSREEWRAAADAADAAAADAADAAAACWAAAAARWAAAADAAAAAAAADAARHAHYVAAADKLISLLETT